MKRMAVGTIVLMLVLAGVGVMAVLRHHAPSTAEALRPRSVSRPPNALERRGWVRGNLVMPMYIPTAEESNALSVACRLVNEAYTNGHVELMVKRMQNIPDVVTNVSDGIQVDVIRSIANSFGVSFLRAKSLMDFPDCVSLRMYLKLNWHMALFLGDVDLKRGCYSGYLEYLDRMVFVQFKRYKEKFHSEGRADFERCADEFISRWIEQIESENGFTRRYMWHQVSLQYGHIEEGSWTLKQLSDFVKFYARGLIKAGYTPKWLEEFDFCR